MTKSSLTTLKKHNKQRPVQQPMEINKLGNKDKRPKCPSKGTQTLSTVFMQGGQGLVKEPLYKVSSQNLCRESSQTISYKIFVQYLCVGFLKKSLICRNSVKGTCCTLSPGHLCTMDLHTNPHTHTTCREGL